MLAGGRQGRTRFGWSLALPFFGAFACGGESTPLECTVSTDPMTAPEAGTVEYEAKTSGPASVSSLTYLAEGSEKNLENPKLPFQKRVGVESGDPIAISVTGTAESGGSFTGSFSFTGASGGSPVTGFANCAK